MEQINIETLAIGIVIVVIIILVIGLFRWLKKVEAYLDNHRRKYALEAARGAEFAIKPSSEDINNPMLWKGIHWRWYFSSTH
jgi:hypothetical protein